jgi:hypothetical protein
MITPWDEPDDDEEEGDDEGGDEPCDCGRPFPWCICDAED